MTCIDGIATASLLKQYAYQHTSCDHIETGPMHALTVIMYVTMY